MHDKPCPRPGAAGSAPWRWPALALLCCCADGALAHDTWFEALPAGNGTRLALGTGARYPLQEFTLTESQLRRSGCRAGLAAPAPLRRERDTPRALILRAPKPAADAGLSCWAESTPFEIEIVPELVAVYLNEIQAGPELREAWSRLLARGLPWKETYTKHARIELPPPAAASSPIAPTSGMGMDVLLESGQPQVGDALVFQVLRDGAPLAGLAVELRSELSPLGIWRRSDASGRVSFQAPLAGRWLLRGTDLRLSSRAPDTWESRFVTLAFEVAPRRAVQADAAAAIRTASP